MATATWRRWAWQYALPVLALGAGALLTRWLIHDDRTGEVLITTFVVAPVLAFLIGLLVRPARVWVVPAITVLLVCVEVVAGEIQNPAETSAGMGLFFAVFLVGFPLTVLIWVGREVGRRLGSLVTGTRHEPPHPSAT